MTFCLRNRDFTFSQPRRTYLSNFCTVSTVSFSALTPLVGRQEGHPEWWGAGVVICLERGADLHMAQLMPLPLTISCSSKIQIGFTFLVPAYPGSPGKSAVKRVCVCVSTAAAYCIHNVSGVKTTQHYQNTSRSDRIISKSKLPPFHKPQCIENRTGSNGTKKHHLFVV